jgi:hypothetical protein
MGFSGSMIKEVFVSKVIAPAAEAAGREELGKGEGAPKPPPADDENVFTVLTSVLIGKLLIVSI